MGKKNIIIIDLTWEISLDSFPEQTGLETFLHFGVRGENAAIKVSYFSYFLGINFLYFGYQVIYLFFKNILL
jgi:hypothetical protein